MSALVEWIIESLAIGMRDRLAYSTGRAAIAVATLGKVEPSRTTAIAVGALLWLALAVTLLVVALQ